MTISSTGNPVVDPVSPELALIDSTLRQRLVHSEPAGGTELVQPSEEIAETAGHAGSGSGGRSFPVRLVALLATLISVAGAGWYWIDRAGVVGAGRPTTRAASARHGADGAAIAQSARVFSWAPVAGVSKYDVQLRRGGAVIFSIRTATSQIRVPARWNRGGKTFTLSAGTYRWYVWPIAPGTGTRRAAAVVSTTFVVHA